MKEQTKLPKELQRNLFGELDRRYWIIFLITLIVHVASVSYLQGVQWAEMTKEEVTRYLETIYRIGPAKERYSSRNVVTLTRTLSEETAEATVTSTESATRQVVTKRRGSKAELAQARDALQASARSTGIFRLAGARIGGGKDGLSGSGIARGLRSDAGLEGIEVGKIAAIATGSEVDKVEKARAGQRITEGSGGIDVTKLTDVQIDQILASSTVEIAALTDVQGLAAKNTNRTSASIRSIADANLHLIKNCYNKYKRKDPNLRGKVKVEWSILPEGKVSKAHVLSSEWTNQLLGRRVEDGLMAIITGWLFDPIPEEAGKVRACQTYIFD
ncbi:MAG: AgmX/PglI C-terminal domain-containing protein [bacterium]